MKQVGIKASPGAKSSHLDSGAIVYNWSGKSLKAKKRPSLTISNIKRWMGIRRVVLYWVEPVFGKDSLVDLKDECQLLIWQDTKGQYGGMLPMLAEDVRFTLKGNNKGVDIVSDGAVDTWPDRADAVMVMRGKEPHALVADLMAAASDHLGTFALRKDKPTVPDYTHYLGWCTWDAFYQSVNKQKVRAGLKTFREKGVQLGQMILDDGWLDTSKGKLNSFRANDKFKGGLKGLADMAKQEFGLQSFGVWHAFQGYWQGVHPKGELGCHYRTVNNKGKIRPWEGFNEKTVSLSLVESTDIHRFYIDFYRYLRQQGVDMTKVDNQSALECFSKNKRGRVSTMRAYQEAFQAAGQQYMNGNILHCMSSSSDVGLNMLTSNAYRNSDDYFPRKGPEAQQHHVWINAYNNILSGQFAIPDWDMFQTHGPCAEFHAMARAISGGPVYVCDKPGKQDGAMLKKMGYKDGSVVRFDNPARVCSQDILVDTKQEKRLLGIINSNGPHYMLGLFHCSTHEGAINRKFGLNAILGTKQSTFACYAHSSGAVWTCDGKDKLNISLAPSKAELLSCVPVDNGVAPLGCLDKYIGCGAIASSRWRHKQEFVCSLHQGSNMVGFYCEQEPGSVTANDVPVPFQYESSTGLLVIKADECPSTQVILQF